MEEELGTIRTALENLLGKAQTPKKVCIDNTDENADWLKEIKTDGGKSFQEQDLAASEKARKLHRQDRDR